MFIRKIIDYDKDVGEADILVTDGQYEIICYVQLFENKNKHFSLFSFLTKDVKRIEKMEYKVTKGIKGYYSYEIQGKIIDVEKRIMRVGDIFITLEDVIPKDIKNNDYIEFSVERIDYIEL